MYAYLRLRTYEVYAVVIRYFQHKMMRPQGISLWIGFEIDTRRLVARTRNVSNVARCQNGLRRASGSIFELTFWWTLEKARILSFAWSLPMQQSLLYIISIQMCKCASPSSLSNGEIIKNSFRANTSSQSASTFTRMDKNRNTHIELWPQEMHNNKSGWFTVAGKFPLICKMMLKNL